MKQFGSGQIIVHTFGENNTPATFEWCAHSIGTVEVSDEFMAEFEHLPWKLSLVDYDYTRMVWTVARNYGIYRVSFIYHKTTVQAQKYYFWILQRLAIAGLLKTKPGYYLSIRDFSVIHLLSNLNQHGKGR